MKKDVQIFNSQFYDPTGTGIVFAKSSDENETLFTTNYVLADFFGKSVGAINKQIKQSQEMVSRVYGKLFQKVQIKGSNGRPRDVYLIDEELANYVISLQQNRTHNGINTREIKARFSKAFYDSRSINMKRQLIHQISKPATKSLADVVHDSTAIGSNGYINVWNEIYKASLNKTTQRLKKEHNVPKGKNTLDYLSVEELSAVNKIKPIVIGLVSAGLNCKEIGQSLAVIKEKAIIDKPKKLMLPMVI